MKILYPLAGLLILVSGSCQAGAGAFIGLTYNFGGSVGISVKVLSTDKQDHAAAALGVAYYPTEKKFGADIGAAYVGNNIAGTLGWDFMNKQAQIGVGYANSKRKPAPLPPTPTPPPPPSHGE